MKSIRKLIVAAVGAVLIALNQFFGVDLTGVETQLIDVIIAIGTAIGVFAVPNEPAEE